ncbi:MAG: hypothetical protein CMG00_05950 [Candidatus Marinimicrobia bacterium]|nr:hypothetical protein [Candidatus Neomarinimicrobiota bacterium]|tara:strand:+ start:123 stop:440 length:318 start_codon:yes stop_codon:yes gene_type:complete
MKKPGKVKIGFYVWKIEWSKEKNEEMYGKTDPMTKIITIYRSPNSQIERETLFHELMHAAGEDKYDSIFQFSGSDKEENLIRILSPVFMQMLSDNRELTKYLFSI